MTCAVFLSFCCSLYLMTFNFMLIHYILAKETKQCNCPLHRGWICQFSVWQVNPTSVHLMERQNNGEIAYDLDIIRPGKPGKYCNI